MSRALTALGAFVMAIGVASAAYASHVMRAASDPLVAAYLTPAVNFTLIHGLGLVMLGILARSRPSRWLAASGALFGAGLALFCGSLWVLALTGQNLHVAPFGGSAFILGWLALAINSLGSDPN